MPIIPAIDLQGGQAVRLLQGDYGKKTVYSNDPTDVAKNFDAMGAKYLHVVDLDGAKAGSTANLEVIRRIREGVSLPIQLGGGIRSADVVDMYLNDIGIDRVILGTVAVKQPSFVKEMLDAHGASRIVVGVDVRFSQVEDLTQSSVLPPTSDTARPNTTSIGYVSTAGWLQDSEVMYLDFLQSLKSMGVKYVVVTDISRDGTLTSPNWEMYEAIRKAAPELNVIVSGGIAEESHIQRAATYYGVIVGKAHYEGKVDLEKCIKTIKPHVR